MLKPLLRKILGTKADVQKAAKFDKINVADDVKQRSPLVKSVVDRTARNFYEKVLGLSESPMPEDFDTNQASSLAMQEFVFTSVAKNPAANLLTLKIVASDAESIEVVDNHIIVSIDDTVSDHDSVKALIDGDEQASELITVAINVDEGATVVVAEDTKEFKGAIG